MVGPEDSGHLPGAVPQKGSEMLKIAIVTGSIRPGRQSLKVAQWVKAEADKRSDADYAVVDIADFDLPVWDEAMPPVLHRYEKQVTKDWAAAMAQFDAYIFVAAEYNHSVTGALKNAIDYLNVEFHNKAAGIVSYGSMGGARAAEHLRGILSELQVAHVRNQVTMPMFTDFPERQFTPSEMSARSLNAMLDQLLPWAKAMELVRNGQLASIAITS
jgi:NAD(P)H-dependent FMN reductase